MKRNFFRFKLVSIMAILFLLVVSCGMPKEIKVPNKRLSIGTNGELLYNKKTPYAGKVIFKEKGGEGYMTLKNGHIEGKTELTSPELTTSFNVVNGELDGEYKSKGTFNGVDINYIVILDKGKLKKYDGKIGTLEQNFTFDDKGRTNGTMKENGVTLTFKDGMTKFQGLTIEMVLTEDKTGLKFRVLDQSGKVIQEKSSPFAFNREMLEKSIFPIFFNEISDEYKKVKSETEKALDQVK